MQSRVLCVASEQCTNVRLWRNKAIVLKEMGIHESSVLDK